MIKKDDHLEDTLTALQEAIEDKKAQMQNVRHQVNVPPMVSNLLSGTFNRAGTYYTQANSAIEQGGEYVREFLRRARQNMKDRPWEVLRKVAVCSFAIGFVLGTRRRRLSAGGKE